MINDKKSYKFYVKEDIEALGAKIRHPLIRTNNSMVWLVDPVVKFQRILRKLEYLENCKKSKLWTPIKLWWRWRFQRVSALLGFSIPLNVCGPGLCILHYGSIVISRHARIGRHCTLNSAVNIGIGPHGDGAPVVGDGVYIGPGAKLWNNITIANGVTIGANACVSKSVSVENVTVVGANRILANK